MASLSPVDNRINGRLALVTGASGGIGSACARQLAAHGVHLALTYSSNLNAITALAEELRKLQPPASTTPTSGTNPASSKDTSTTLRITTHKCDISSVSEIQQLCLDVARDHGRAVDILISNAGHGKRIVDIWDIPVEEFEYTLNVNLRAGFCLAKGVVDGMRDQKWGRIVFVGSIAAYGAGINGCHYAASKGGLMSLMKNLSQRLAVHNITVNDVAPAMIGATGMIPSADAVPGVVEGIPVGRLGTPEEVAAAVVMFVGNGYTTGQSLVMAGGLRHL